MTFCGAEKYIDDDIVRIPVAMHEYFRDNLVHSMGIYCFKVCFKFIFFLIFHLFILTGAGRKIGRSKSQLSMTSSSEPIAKKTKKQ